MAKFHAENLSVYIKTMFPAIWYNRCFNFFRKERVLKEKRFKEEITDLAKSINRESQEMVRIARSTAEACTDRTMKQV